MRRMYSSLSGVAILAALFMCLGSESVDKFVDVSCALAIAMAILAVAYKEKP